MTSTGTVPASRPPASGPDTSVGDDDGFPALAHDGEAARLARITLAIRLAESRPPASGRLVALCAWATAIGIAGLLLVARTGLALLVHPPAWFVPSAAATGLVGFACTAAAFLAARRRVVPWTLLGLATCAIGVSILLISLVGAPPSVASIP